MNIANTQKDDDNDDITFPNAVPLDIKFYNNDAYNKLRRCKLILLSECLGNNSDFIEKYNKCDKIINTMLQMFSIKVVKTIGDYLIKTKQNIIEEIERGCLNTSIQKAKKHNIRCVWTNSSFINLYHSICYKTSININISSSVQSKHLYNIIMDDQENIKLCDIANMSSKKLCPAKYIVIDEKIKKRLNFEHKVKYSMLYWCSKCKRNQTTTERRYARSLDEGVDLTINCVFCGHSWNA